MRRLPVPLMAVLGLGLVLALAVVSNAPRCMRSAVRPSHLPNEIVHRVVSRAVQGFLACADVAVSPAWAADSLRWRTAAPGSTTLEPRRNRRVVVQTPEAPQPADVPEPPAIDEPVVPDVPATPEVLVSKSGSITRIGSDVHVEKDQVVAGDLVALGGDVIVDGHVEGDLVAMGGDVKLSATARVDGDVATIGGRLTEETGAVVGGQRVSAAGMRGMKRIRHADLGEETSNRREGHVTASLVWILIMLLVSWGFASIAPGRTAGALATLRREPGLSFGVGMLIWALVVPGIVALSLIVAILCITIIGIPLAIAALFGYFLFVGMVAVWGFVVAMAGVGSWFVGRRNANAVAAPGITTAPSPSLTRLAATGVILIAGAGLVGELLKSMGPFHGLGTFLAVMSIIALAFAATFGAGAWLRTEIVSDTLGRWWRGRRRPVAPEVAPVSAAPVEPVAPVAPTPPPPAAPEDPSRWQPPGGPVR